MPVKVIGPDGAEYQFPDGTDKTAAVAYFKRKGVGAAPATFSSQSQGDWRDALTRINPHQSDTPIHAVEDVLGNIGAGALGVVLRPVATAEGIGTFLRHPIQGAEAMAGQFINPNGTVNPRALENAEGLIGQSAAFGAAGEAVGPLKRGLMEKVAAAREGVRTGTQSLMGAGENTVKEKVAATAKSAGEKAKATEESNRAELNKHNEAVNEAGQKDVNAHIKHLQQKAEAEQANAAAEMIPDSRAGLEKSIDEKSWLREQRIESAEKAAKKDLDERYEKQRELLGDETIPPTSEPNALTGRNIGERAVNAFQSFITNPEAALPKIIKMLNDRAGDLLGWRDLSGIRSEISQQLSTGRLSGETYQGYKAALGVVDEGLQKIADNFGVGDVVKKNRADYAHFANTFYDSIHEPNTIARKTQTSTSPEYVRSSEETARREALDKYDKSIGRLGSEIDSANGRLSALPSAATRPTAVAPAYPEPTEVTPPKTNPIEVPELSTPKIREDLIGKWTRGESGLNKFQVSRLIGSAGVGTVIGAIFGHGLGTEVGSAAGAISYALSPAIVAKIISRPAVLEFLTRAPAGELETLQKVPYADRVKITDGLKSVVQQAQAQGIKVNPELAALVGATTTPRGPKTQQIQKTADDARNSQATH